MAGTRYQLGTIDTKYFPVHQIEKFVITAANDAGDTHVARLIITQSGIVYFSPYVDRDPGDNIRIYECYV